MHLGEFDYSFAGFYFVTFVTKKREKILGEIMDGEMKISPFGYCVLDVWQGLPSHYRSVVLDGICIMPDHVHAVIQIVETRPDHQVKLSNVMSAWKGFSSRRINQLRAVTGRPVWQTGYYEHVVRNDLDLQRIRQYIIDNPRRWEEKGRDVFRHFP